jgi:hypothetical protein
MSQEPATASSVGRLQTRARAARPARPRQLAEQHLQPARRNVATSRRTPSMPDLVGDRCFGPKAREPSQVLVTSKHRETLRRWRWPIPILISARSCVHRRGCDRSEDSNRHDPHAGRAFIRPEWQRAVDGQGLSLLDQALGSRPGRSTRFAHDASRRRWSWLDTPVVGLIRLCGFRLFGSSRRNAFMGHSVGDWAVV